MFIKGGFQNAPSVGSLDLSQKVTCQPNPFEPRHPQRKPQLQVQPSSSMAESSAEVLNLSNQALGMQQWPRSAFDNPVDIYEYLGSQMLNPGDPNTANLKSVFDSDLGSFMNQEDIVFAKGDHLQHKVIHHQSDLDPHDV